MKNIIGLIVTILYILITMTIARIFEKKGKEISRKFIHIMLGNWWILAMIFFDNVIYASIEPILFIILNYISYKKDIIKVMERDDKEEKTLGTVYYAISLFIIVIITYGILNNPKLGIVPIFIMAYGDGLAAVMGKIIKSKEYKIGNSKKTIAGSLTMFIVSTIIIAVYLICTNAQLWIIKSIIMGIILTVIEAISIKGTDNLTIPICTLLMLIW